MLIAALIATILGACALVAGTLLIYPPAALIVAGLLAFGAARMAVRAAKPGDQ